MRINKICSVRNNFVVSPFMRNKINKTDINRNFNLNGLDNLALYNQVGFKGKDKSFEIALSSDELKKRTDNKLVADIELLNSNSPEYLNLNIWDKQALSHLVKAADILDDVFLQQDNQDNLLFKNYLLKEVENGNEDAKNALTIFNSQKGVNGVDNTMAKVNLAKDVEETLGRGFYPKDLEVEEFHSILNKMLDDGENEEVSKILNQRSMVVRDGDKLKAVDYTKYFKKEFTAAARELEKASMVSSDERFNDFLVHQALALLGEYPLEDAIADKKWADMQNTPLEFTITRENYSDRMTKTIPENKQLMDRLQKAGIKVFPKDSIGVRVGIVNKQGTQNLLGIKEYLPKIAKLMPHQDLYIQEISTRSSKQAMVDADLVYVTGDTAKIRAGVTIAENLPNSDKLSLQMGGGRRNVYHRQVRETRFREGGKAKLDALLNPNQHDYFSAEARHRFVIGHENMHSLGPKKNPKLGKYVDIFEEMKADSGSLAFLTFLVNEGLYTDKERKDIIVTEVLNKGMKSMPDLSKTHRACDVIEFNYLYNKGAFDVDKNGVITVYFDEVEKQSQAMLDEVIEIQATGDIEKAEKFVDTYFYWSQANERHAEKLNQVNNTLSFKFVTPLADEILKDS